MKKLLFSLIAISLMLGLGASLALAQDTPPVNPTPTSGTNPQAVCIQNVVEKRDTAIITAYTKYSSAVLTALNTRKAELKTAWAITTKNERRKAIAAAWAKFKKTQAGARSAWAKEKNAAWKAFKTEAKGCKVTTSDDPTTQYSTDEKI